MTKYRPAGRLYIIGVRFSAKERAAIESAAKADDRPVSVLIRKIVVDALKAKGLLK